MVTHNNLSRNNFELKKLISGWGLNSFSFTELIDLERTDVNSDNIFDRASKFIPRGLGRSYGDAAQLTGGRTVCLQSDISFKLDEATGQLEASAGCSLDFLLKKLVPNGWFLPVVPGTRYVSIGGAIAADIHGKNHHNDGSFGNFVLSLDVLTPRGKITCSPNHNSELFWATIGGMGLTGLILSAKIKLLKINSSYILADIKKFKNIYDLLEFVGSNDTNYKYSVAWIDMLAKGNNLGRGILSAGNHAEVAELTRSRVKKKFNYNPKQNFSVPIYFPAKTLNKYSTGFFNKLWYFKDKKDSKKILTIPSFFHPLDGVKNWNKIYGRSGFIQYQFVVPTDEIDFLIYVLKQFSQRKIPIFLAVLKKMGESSKGLLSFPKPGWTLALDIPASTTNLEGFLYELDEKVIERNGRIYLAKDSLLNARRFEKMYSNLNEFKRIREMYGLNDYIESDLSRRLTI